PGLHLPYGPVRILRQPALGRGGGRRPDRGQVRRAAELRDVAALQRPGEGGACLRRGDRLAPGDAGRVLGADAGPFHGAGTRTTGVRHRAHVRAAELAADAEHRAPRGDGGDGRLDGTGVRDPGEDGGDAGLGRLLGQALTRARPDPGYPAFSTAEMARRWAALAGVLADRGADACLVYGAERAGAAGAGVARWAGAPGGGLGGRGRGAGGVVASCG